MFPTNVSWLDRAAGFTITVLHLKIKIIHNNYNIMKDEKLKTFSGLKLRTVSSVMRRGHPASSTYQSTV